RDSHSFQCSICLGFLRKGNQGVQRSTNLFTGSSRSFLHSSKQADVFIKGNARVLRRRRYTQKSVNKVLGSGRIIISSIVDFINQKRELLCLHLPLTHNGNQAVG